MPDASRLSKHEINRRLSYGELFRILIREALIEHKANHGPSSRCGCTWPKKAQEALRLVGNKLDGPTEDVLLKLAAEVYATLHKEGKIKR